MGGCLDEAHPNIVEPMREKANLLEINSGINNMAVRKVSDLLINGL